MRGCKAYRSMTQAQHRQSRATIAVRVKRTAGDSWLIFALVSAFVLVWLVIVQRIENRGFGLCDRLTTAPSAGLLLAPGKVGPQRRCARIILHGRPFGRV